MFKNIFLITFFIMAFTAMPAFSLMGASDCPSSVKDATDRNWLGLGMQSGFENFYSDFEKSVYSDKESLEKFKKRVMDAIKDETLLGDWIYTKPLKCGSDCYFACNSFHATCKDGEKLKDCNESVYACYVSSKIGEEYQEYMVKKICATSSSTSKTETSNDTSDTKTSKSNKTTPAPESNQVYKKQGPFTKALKKCDTGSFMVYKDYSGQSKQQNEAELQEWQNACTSLANCRRASEMTWKVAQGDKIDTYTCVPKKCLPDFPINEDGWCEQIPEKRLEYKNQGPFPKSACYNGPFNLYHYYTGTPKMYNNDELKLWQKSCEKLADCKHASKMTWDIVKGDTFDTYSCVPKTCLPDYPKKEKSGCEKDAENEQQQKGTDAKKIEQKINAAVSRGVKPGDEINLESVSSDATVVKALSKWEKSCTQAKAEHAKKIEAVNTGNVHSCKITSCDKGFNTSDGKQCTPDNRESSVSDAAQKAIDQIEASINHGVKVGSSINVGAVADESDVAAALAKWEKACRKSTRPEGAQRIDVIPQHGYGRQCVITSCDEKDYTRSSDNLSCVKNTTETNKTEEPKSRSRKEQEDKQTKKQADCTAKGGELKSGLCYCDGTILTGDKTCEDVKNEKTQKENDKNQRKIDKETEKTEKENKCEKEQHGKFELGKCLCGLKELSEGEDCDNIKKDKQAEKDKKKDEKNEDKTQKETECKNKGGKYKAGSCWCNGIILTGDKTCGNNGKKDESSGGDAASDEEVQQYLDEINRILKAGVKVGEVINVPNSFYNARIHKNPNLASAYKKLETACNNAQKTSHEKTTYLIANKEDRYSTFCAVTTCEDNFIVDKSETKCIPVAEVQKEQCTMQDATYNDNDGNCYCHDELWAYDNPKYWNHNNWILRHHCDPTREEIKESKNLCKDHGGTVVDKKCYCTSEKKKDIKNSDSSKSFNPETHKCTADKEIVALSVEEQDNSNQNETSDKNFLSDVDKIINAYKETVQKIKQTGDDE